MRDITHPMPQASYRRFLRRSSVFRVVLGVFLAVVLIIMMSISDLQDPVALTVLGGGVAFLVFDVLWIIWGIQQLWKIPKIGESRPTSAITTD